MHPDDTTPRPVPVPVRLAPTRRSGRTATAPEPTPATREPHIYVRVSTYVQAQEGFSLPQQFDVCHLQAKVDGQTIRPENVLHDIDSGAKFDRTFLTELLTRVQQGRVSAVYCPEVDRLARDPGDGLKILEVLRAHNIQLVLVKDKIDTSTDHGEMFFLLMLMFAKWERRQIKERTWNGKITKTNQYHQEDRQFYPGGRHVPYGLTWTPATKDADGCWGINQEQRKWVLKIFEWAVSCSSIAIAERLNDRGVPSPTGGVWNDVTVRNIIRSTTYLGQFKHKLHGKEYVFAVPRIVPDDLWQRANAALAKKVGNSTSKRNSKHEYLLSGLVKCLACHEQGREKPMGGRYEVPKYGRDRIYYRCANRERARHVHHTVGGEKLEAAVWGYLCAIFKDPSTILSRLRKLQDAASKEYQDVQDQIDGLVKVLADNKEEQKRVATLYRKGKLSEDVLDEQSAALEQEARETEGKLALLRVQLQDAQQNTLPLKEVEDACTLLAQGLEEFTFEDKRWLISTVVDVIYAGKEGWRMEGKLPGLVDGSGEFGKSTGTQILWTQT